MDVIDRLTTAARRLLADQPVQFAYLFGSQARGDARSDSDIDVAVRFGDEVDPADRFALATELAGRLAVDAGVGPINGVVVLNDAPLRLAGRILQDRVVLYSADEAARVAYEVRTRALALDFELHAAPMDRALLGAMGREDR